MKKFLKTRKMREQEELLAQYVWDFPRESDLEMLPFQKNETYGNRIASEVMNNFAITLFKKSCSEMGFYYQEVEGMFLSQNKSFFQATRTIYKKEWGSESGEYLKEICSNLLVPKQSRVREVLEEIRKWSPEEQAEALQLLAGIKIKITVEDI